MDVREQPDEPVDARRDGLDLDELPDERLSGLAEKDLAGPGGAFELVRDRDRTADGELAFGRRDEDVPGVDRGLDFEEHAVLREQAVVQQTDPVPEFGGRTDRPECVVLAHDRYSEDGERAPGLHARYAAVPVDRRARAIAEAVEERPEHLRLQPDGELSGVRDPCDDHRHRLARRPGWERAPYRSKARARPRRSAERGILPKDRPLELLQLLARVDAEVLDEHAACVLVGGQGLRLPPRLVQGEHQEGAQMLAVRMLASSASSARTTSACCPSSIS